MLAACTPVPPVCEAGDAPGTVTLFAADVGPTEGITFSDDGRLFASGGDRILELAADGSARVFATVPKVVGLAWWGDALFAASGDDGTGESTGAFCDATRRGAIYRISREGVVTRFAVGIRAPNFLAVTPWGRLLVSDDCVTNDRIFEIDASGVVRPWLGGIVSANGLGFSPDGSRLFLVTTFVNPPALFQVAIGADGVAGAAVREHDFADGSSPDGLALDRDGVVYVALNTGSRIERRRVDGTVEPFADGLEFPASLAFGEGAGFDACSVYVTSLFGQHVSRVRVGVPGLSPRR